MSEAIFDKNATAKFSLGIAADKRKYKLDNAAEGFSLMSSKKVSCVFRIACTLKENVDVKKLHKALANILPRFPYFRVSIKKGFIWGKWITNLSIPEIMPVEQYTNQYIPIGRKKLLYRILVNQNRIAIECHHSLTDGHGGLIFLNSLIAEYFNIKKTEIDNWENIFNSKKEPDYQEFENAFDQNYKRKVKRKSTRFGKRSFNIPFKTEPPGVIHTSKVTVSVKEVKQKAKEFNVSVTGFLSALYMDSLKTIQEDICKNKTRRMKPIRLNVPVNLRRVLPSITMRNFTLCVTPNIDPKKKQLTLKEIILQVNDCLKNKIIPETFYQMIARNTRSLSSPIMQIAPFQVKRFFARKGYYFFRTPYYSGILTNLGKITLPKSLTDRIDSYDIVIGPGPVNKVRVGVASFEDNLVLTFSRVIKEPILAEVFCKKLEGQNVAFNFEPYKIP
ncbi:MAG: hypothetical protein ACTSSN_12375 [Candidatus Heimdallarchaeaceae archaeon]